MSSNSPIREKILSIQKILSIPVQTKTRRKKPHSSPKNQLKPLPLLTSFNSKVPGHSCPRFIHQTQSVSSSNPLKICDSEIGFPQNASFLARKNAFIYCQYRLSFFIKYMKAMTICGCSPATQIKCVTQLLGFDFRPLT